jgi:7-cyano-7-deazaguanine synthase
VAATMTQNKKCVIVLSGGPDSTTVAYWAKKQGYGAYAISFKYGQIATKEVGFARKIAEKLQIPLKVVDLSSLKEIFGYVTSLCNENIPMTSNFSDPIIVPFRNAIFLSAAVSYAVSIEANKIFYGAQGSDEPFYPDCRKEFYKAFEKAAQLGTNTEISVEAPFSGKTKAKLFEEGAKLGVPFELTWSCYRNEDKHCGTCESCLNRKKAFAKAKIDDPTEYNQ